MNEFDFLALQVNRILELPRKWVYAGKETNAKIKQKGTKKKKKKDRNGLFSCSRKWVDYW